MSEANAKRCDHRHCSDIGLIDWCSEPGCGGIELIECRLCGTLICTCYCGTSNKEVADMGDLTGVGPRGKVGACHE